MIDTLIIGHGPAGVSAALYTVRAGMETVLIGKDGGALDKAERIENFYGHADPISGKQLLEEGLAQIKRLGAVVLTDEVVGLRLEDCFTVETTGRAYESDTVVIATGASRSVPDIRDLTTFEGRGVSYCAVCDAFFFRGKDTAVLGNGPYALHETNELKPIVKSVTVLTNGHAPQVAFPSDIRVITEPVAALSGSSMLEGIYLSNGEMIPAAGLFVALGVAGSTDLAKKIGAVTENERIVTDQYLRTSVPGLWAAGDCTGGMKQIAKAVYEGAAAGTDVVKYLRSRK